MRRAFALRSFSPALDRFPDFRPRVEFNFQHHPHWFVSHMSRGKVRIQKKMKDVDVLLEVRDARAPFSSAQIELTAETGTATRLVVLNKADLITPNVGLSMRNLIEEGGQPCLLTAASLNKNLVKIKNFALDNVRSKHPRTLGVMLMVVGLPNVGKSTILNGLKRIAFTTARHQRVRHQGRESKLVHGVKWKESNANKTPGLTRDVSFFQISNQPRLYCYDTPGVMLAKRRNDPERNTKLALLGAMPDHMAGELYLADYLLYRLNKARVFTYVDELELPGPTDDIQYLSAHCNAVCAARKSMCVTWADLNAGARFFLGLFREGHLGRVCLDHIPDPDEIQELRAISAQTEPPGPWGPPCFPEVPRGLELNRRAPDLPEGFVLPRGAYKS